MSFKTELPTTIEKSKEPGIPKEVLDMYVVPGYEESYTEHSLQRYRRESEQLEQDMAEANEILQSGDFSNVKAEMIPMLLSIAQGEQIRSLVLRKFEIENSAFVLAYPEAIKHSEKEISAECIYGGFLSDDHAVRLSSSEAIGYVNELDRADLIRVGLATNDPAVMFASAEAIRICDDTERADLIRVGLATGNSAVMLVVAKMIQSVDAPECASLIRAGFATEESATMLASAKAIKYAGKSERADLIRDGLATNDPAVILASAEAIKSTAISERPDLHKKIAQKIRHIIATADSAGMLIGIEAIQYAKISERADFIRSGLAIDDPAVIFASARNIVYCDDLKQSSLRKVLAQKIRDSFVKNDPESMRNISNAIPYVEISELTNLILQGFLTNDPAVMLASAKAIGSARGSERGDLIRAGFVTNDPTVMLASAYLIWLANAPERADLVRVGLATNDPAVMLASANAIRYAHESERAPIIRSSFETKDPAVILALAESINYAKDSEQLALRKELAQKLRNSFNESDPDDNLVLLDAIKFVEISEREKLYELVREMTGPAFVEGPLYNNVKARFSREAFKKNGGAETTLLGTFSDSDLKKRIIVRHFKQKYFLEWKKLYDDHAFWKQNGFDYIPIEPIVSFSPRKSGMIDAYTGVLDLSLRDWNGRSDLWVSELRDDQKKLMSILSEIGYDHGHYNENNGFSHDGNFCLRFFRHDDGSIDYSKKPRLYLIDFDEASFKKDSEEV